MGQRSKDAIAFLQKWGRKFGNRLLNALGGEKLVVRRSASLPSQNHDAERHATNSAPLVVRRSASYPPAKLTSNNHNSTPCMEAAAIDMIETSVRIIVGIHSSFVLGTNFFFL